MDRGLLGQQVVELEKGQGRWFQSQKLCRKQAVLVCLNRVPKRQMLTTGWNYVRISCYQNLPSNFWVLTNLLYYDRQYYRV